MASIISSRGNIILDLLISLSILSLLTPLYIGALINIQQLQRHSNAIDATLNELHHSINQPTYSPPSLSITQTPADTFTSFEFTGFHTTLRWAVPH